MWDQEFRTIEPSFNPGVAWVKASYVIMFVCGGGGMGWGIRCEIINVIYVLFPPLKPYVNVDVCRPPPPAYIVHGVNEYVLQRN